MTDAEYRSETQAWVEGTVYYRNLAISLGATPDQMLNPSDRRLAEMGLTDAGPGYWSHDDEMKEIRAMWEALSEATIDGLVP